MTASLALVGGAHSHVDYILDELARRDDVQLVAVVDHDPRRLDGLMRRTGAPGYADLEPMLDAHRPDGAAVISEPGLRATAIATLLARDIFVIADKPMALSLAEIDQLAAADGGRSRIALMLEKRFYPTTLAARDLVAEGTLGDIVSIWATGPHKLRPAGRPDWYFDPKLYGDILTDLTVHDVDLAMQFAGASSGTVSGWISSRAAEGTKAFASAGRAVMSFDNGIQAAIDVDWLQPEASPRHGDYAMRLQGTRGRADLMFAENRLLVETDTRPRYEATLPAGAPPARNAFDVLAGKAKPAVSTAEALLASRIASLSAVSAADGGKAIKW
jgi:predicted dehydrogenase